MKKWLISLGIFLIVVLLGFSIWAYAKLHDRHPGYAIDIDIRPSAPAPLKAGFAALTITPDIVDTWTDQNGDAVFNEKDGDRYHDNNNNGRFDAVWIAGFGNARPANGVHDDLWARCLVFDDGRTRIAIVSLDAIGFFHDDVVDVRKRIPEAAGIDYTMVLSTHDHEAPDLMGLWGKSQYQSGVNAQYMAYVKQQAASCTVEAAGAMRPARLRVAQDLDAARKLVNDTRMPFVLDPGLRLVQAIDSETAKTLGVMVAWANHPETLWSKNLLISSDFPHYVRAGIERGIYHDGALVQAGIGGIAVYVNGAIGGLMTTDAGHKIEDPFSGKAYITPSFDKIRAQGEQLALLSLRLLESSDVTTIEKASIGLRARTIDLPLDNTHFKIAAFLGILDRGLSGWMKVRSEIAAWSLDEMSFVCIPGEIYPEIVEGGIESPPGQDFQIKALEVPPIRSGMTGQYKFVLGLANDEIGYIIPKSEWDEFSPYLYMADKPTYGEINSLGSETAPIIHRKIKVLLDELVE